MITQKRLKELVSYNQDSGKFFWKKRDGENKSKNNYNERFNSRFSGVEAGNKDPSGYIKIRIDKKLYGAHRLVILYTEGFLPDFADHKDRDRSNNARKNIRVATKLKNQQNRSPSKNSTSKFVGVFWDKSKSMWSCSIKHAYKFVYRKRFKCEIDAAMSYDKVSPMYKGRFSNQNLPCMSVDGIQRIVVEI